MLLEPITKQQEKILFNDIGYSRQKLKSDLAEIREWLKRQHHLPASRLKEKDSFLQMYITGSKGNLETVKRKLDAYYTYRSHTDLYKSRDPLDADYAVAKEYFNFCALPRTAETIPVRVIMFSLSDPEVKKFDMVAYARKVLSFVELRMRIDEICLKDFLVINCKGSSVGHILKLKPFLMRDMARITQDILPFRYNKALFINAPSYVEIAINNLIKPLLSKKLKERIEITSGDFDEIYQYIDKSCLPEDYGGTNYPKLKELSDKWHVRELEERDWYLNDLSEHTDEAKRIRGKDSIENQFTGFKGTLKKFMF